MMEKVMANKRTSLFFALALSTLLLGATAAPHSRLSIPSLERLALCQIALEGLVPTDILTEPSGGLWWASQTLRPERLVSHDRLNEIVDLLFDENSALNAEVDAQLRLLPPGSAEFWDTYFKAYDRVIAWKDGYRMTALLADSYLAKTGLILDKGAGTGNHTNHLLELGPHRRIEGVDKSPDGIRRANAKAHALVSLLKSSGLIEVATPHLSVGDVRERPLAPRNAAGVFMNFVLFVLEPEEQLEVLKIIHADLQNPDPHIGPGGPGYFILNEPGANTQNSREKIRQFFVESFGSAIANNAPGSEFDYAFIVRLNLNFLMLSNHKFYTENRLRELAARAGFRVLHMQPSYHGLGVFTALEKIPE